MRFSDVVGVIAVLGIMLLAIYGALSLSHRGGREGFPESVTTADRSCRAQRCVELLPGGILRWTTPDGTVIRVEYTR